MNFAWRLSAPRRRPRLLHYSETKRFLCESSHTRSVPCEQCFPERREGRAHRDGLMAHGMFERQTGRMECDRAVESMRRPVFHISADRRAVRRQLNANLMT